MRYAYSRDRPSAKRLSAHFSFEGEEMSMAKREIDQENKTITLEFSNGAVYGPIELNPTTDVLTKMIGVLMEKVLSLEEKVDGLSTRIR